MTRVNPAHQRGFSFVDLLYDHYQGSFTSTSVLFHLSDHSTQPKLYTAAPFTFFYETQATQAQRENFDIIANGKIVEWAELGQMVTVEQVVES